MNDINTHIVSYITDDPLMVDGMWITHWAFVIPQDVYMFMDDAPANDNEFCLRVVG